VRYRATGFVAALVLLVTTFVLLSSLTVAQQRGETPVDPAAAGQRGARGAGRRTAPTGPPPRDSQGRADLSGIWMSGGFGGGQRSDPVPYTPEAQQQVRVFQSRQNIEDPMGLCLLVGIPRIYSMPMPFRIIQMPNEVIFLHEAFRGIRIVPTDGRQHPADFDPAYLGSSVGRWEGDTLVIDVRNFNDRTWLGYGATHHTDKLQITERLTRTGPETISYEAVITDPGVFTKPWTVRSGFSLRPNERIREYECHENNLEVVKFQELLKKPELFVDPSRLQPRQ
jgi:hypothetical protein